MGYRVASQLRELDVELIILDPTPVPQLARSWARQGGLLTLVDASEEQVLLDNGLIEARALAAATSDDPVNLRIAFTAEGLNPSLREGTRRFNQQMVEPFAAQFPHCALLSLSAQAAPSFVAAALDLPIGWPPARCPPVARASRCCSRPGAGA